MRRSAEVDVAHCVLNRPHIMHPKTFTASLLFLSASFAHAQLNSWVQLAYKPTGVTRTAGAGLNGILYVDRLDQKADLVKIEPRARDEDE